MNTDLDFFSGYERSNSRYFLRQGAHITAMLEWKSRKAMCNVTS